MEFEMQSEFEALVTGNSYQVIPKRCLIHPFVRFIGKESVLFHGYLSEGTLVYASVNITKRVEDFSKLKWKIAAGETIPEDMRK